MVTGSDTSREPSGRMRAVVQHRAGGPDVLFVTDVPRPVPRMTEILVRVHAAGINPTDWKTRARGEFPIGAKPPFTLGYDVAGTVVEVGRGVTIHCPGDQVIGMPRYPHPSGAYAEYVTGPARHFVSKPDGVDDVHAAALPLASLTAWQALVDTAGIQPGQRVLIHAAAGGVGHLAVQIAKARGAAVVGTARREKHPTLHRLGADLLIDYTKEDFAARLRDIDVVLDCVGGDYGPRSVRTLRPGGTLISLLPLDRAFAEQPQLTRAIDVRHLLVEPDHAGLKAITQLVQAGQLRPLVDAVYPLERAGEAHARGECGTTTGKLVLEVHRSAMAEPSTRRTSVLDRSTGKDSHCDATSGP